MASLAISGVHLSDVARRVEVSISDLEFRSTEAAGCGSQNVAAHIASMETWCGARMAIIAEDVDGCARGLDHSVATFSQLDQSMSTAVCTAANPTGEVS